MVLVGIIVTVLGFAISVASLGVASAVSGRLIMTLIGIAGRKATTHKLPCATVFTARVNFCKLCVCTPTIGRRLPDQPSVPRCQ